MLLFTLNIEEVGPPPVAGEPYWRGAATHHSWQFEATARGFTGVDLGEAFVLDENGNPIPTESGVGFILQERQGEMVRRFSATTRRFSLG